MRLVLAAAIVASLLPAEAGGLDAFANGKADASDALQAAVDATPSGGLLRLKAGTYQVSRTIKIARPITISGTGLGTQIAEQADKTLFRLTNVNGGVLQNLYLGSSATASGTGLIELVNSNHNRIDNVTMLGAYYGLHLKGSLLNTAVDLRTGTNFQGFFATTSPNQTWVYAEPFNAVSANANTFIAPVLEGGVNGIALNDGTGQGSLTITGGSIEGVSGTALAFNGSFLPTLVSGLHMEANQGADVTIDGASNITLSTILSLAPIALTGDTRNVLITGGTIDHIEIAATTKRIRIENVTTGVKTCSNNIVNNNPGSAPDGTPNVVLAQIGNYCGGQ